MTDHPNPFAIGQRVLFISAEDPRAQWRQGTIATVGAIDNMRHRVHDGGYGYWEEEAEHHDDTCDRFVYSVFTGNADAKVAPIDGVCTCRYHIADANADAANRWNPLSTPLITERHQLKLLLVDIAGQFTIDSSGTPLEETDIVHLSGPGGQSAEVDIHDLVKWSASLGTEG